MSTLLEQASLVMIPSGYKEDVVYSQIPTSGAGDLSFTRASNGTRINSAGLVEVTPWNLVEQSETFDNATWTKAAGGTSTVTVTANYGTAPNGTNTADRIQLTRDSSGFAQVIQTITTTASQSYTFSVYLKSLSGTPTVMFGSYGGTNAQTATLTNEWVRYTWTATSPSTAAYGMLMIWGGIASTSLSADFLAWGYQLVEGSTAKPYFPTTDRLNVPRLTYQNGGGGCPSLLLEPQRTNLVSYSEQFDNAYWSKYLATVTADTAISPDGTQNADLVYPSSTGSLAGQLFRQISSGISSGNVVTISAFVKASGKNFAYLSQIQNSFSPDAYFNLTTGAITNISSGVTASMTQLTNSWWRISITSTAGAGSYYAVVGSTDSAGSITNTASGTNGILVYGYQVEVGAYPTSYIPTTSSSATRVADACFKTGISSLIGQTEGVIFYDGVLTGISNPYANLINSEKNVTGSFSIGQRISTGAILCGFFVGGSGVMSFDAGSYALGTRTKIAFAYKSGSFALYVNGTQLATSSATFTPVENIDDIYIGDETTFFNYKENTQVNQVALFKTRLTNAELASLTTI